MRSQICQCETRWAGKRCAQAPLIIFNFPRGAGGTFLCPPSSCSAEGGPGQPPVPTHTHTHNPHPAVETRFSSGGTQPRRRTSRVHRRYETPPGRARGRGRAPRSRCAAGPRLTPSPPCQPSAGPCRSGRNQTPPLRPACGAARLGTAQHSTARLGTARLCSPSPLSARRSLLREAGGAAAVRDAEGLRAPSEAGTGSSPGAQPPRLLKTETLRLRRSLCFPFHSPARLASLHVLSGRGASARPHGRLQRRQGQNGVEERR